MEKQQLLKQEIKMMTDLDIVEECESAWAAPVVLVPKPDNTIRVCVDYRKLNAVTEADSYPLPRIDDLLHMAKASVITTLDLRTGYWQVSVRPEDRDKTAFITPFGVFRFKRMPFGLKNAPATFQRLIDRFRTGLPQVSVLAYLYDIIILSESVEKHLEDLNVVFQRLRQFKLHVKRSKCHFIAKQVRYLGHLISVEGIATDPEKTAVIGNWRRPKNQKEVTSFIQTCSWYRRFIPQFAAVSKPLTELLKKNSRWEWTPTREETFNKLKELLTTPPVLRQADPTLPFVLRTDASKYALGAVLAQGTGPEERPIEYASRLLSPAERNYTTTEREALGVVWSLGKFRGYIDGNHVTLLTDHQPLKWLMSLKTPSRRLARWALAIKAQSIDITYIPGKANVVADALSRPPCHHHTEETCDICLITIDMPHRTSTNIREGQLNDPEIRKIIKCFEDKTASPIDFTRWTSRGYLMSQGILYRYSPDSESEDAQLMVPENERQQVLQEYHDAPSIGHYGGEKTYARIATRYFWIGMRQYILNYVKNCQECQRYKSSNLKPAGLLQTPALAQRFENLAIDLFGPLPEGPNQEKWIVIVEDTASKWVELFALKQADAKSCAQTLIEEIFLRNGIPRRVISDNGTQFISHIMQYVTHYFNIKQSLTPVYHPQANPVERKNRDLKPQIAILVKNDHTSWPDKLPSIRFSMNTVVNKSMNHTAAYLTFGREPRTMDDVTKDQRAIILSDNFIPEITPYLRRLEDTIRESKLIQEKRQDKYKEAGDKHRREAPPYQVGDLVLVTTHVVSNAQKRSTAKFIPRRDGPYVILEQKSATTFEIANPKQPDIPLGKYHVSALQPYRTNTAEIPTATRPIRKRGRPPKRQNSES